MKKKQNRKLYFLILVGHLGINLPVLALCLGLPALLVQLVDGGLAQFLAGICGFILGTGIAWLLWAFLITKWRLWAFQQIEPKDYARLQSLAVEQKLIWEAGSLFEQTEIRNKKEKETVSHIDTKIKHTEQRVIKQLTKDLPETVGYPLSKRQNLVGSGAMIVVLTLGIAMQFTDLYPLGLLLFIIILVDLKKLIFLKHCLSSANYLQLDYQGIQIGFQTKNFISWIDITDLQIDQEKQLLSLQYYRQGKKRKLDFELWRLAGYDYTQFRQQIQAFMKRYKQRQIE